MSGPIELVSAERALEMVTARIAQLDQAIATLGPDTLLGTFMAGSREVWRAAQHSLTDHPEDCPRETPVECLLTQLLSYPSPMPFRQVAADELSVALAGCTTLPEMAAWVNERTL